MLYARRPAQFCSVVFTLLATLLIGACGGGGGGGSKTNPAPTPELPEYTGNTNPAPITSTNALAVLKSVFGYQDATNVGIPRTLGSSAATPGAPQRAPTSVQLQRRVLRAVDAMSAAQWQRLRSPARVLVNENLPGDVSGTARITGNISSNNTGTLTIRFDNYSDGEGVIDGEVRLQIRAWSDALLLPSQSVMTFAGATIRHGTKTTRVHGSLESTLDLAANTETLRVNMIAVDTGSGTMTQWEDYTEVDTYDSLLTPFSMTATIQGRVFDFVEGYVDVETLQAVQFSYWGQDNPDGGGPLEVRGASGSALRVEPRNASTALVRIDPTGAGTFAVLGLLDWSTFTFVTDNPPVDDPHAGPPPTDNPSNAPLIDLPATISAAQGQKMALNADRNGAVAADTTYTWELTSKPAGSAAVLSTTAGGVAEFTADAVGTYIVSVNAVHTTRGSASGTLTVDVTFVAQPLDFLVTDAEYSVALNSMVMVDADSRRLYVLNADDLSVTRRVDLPATPTAVSVSPDGLYAAVGHDGSASYVDLSAGTVLKRVDVTANVLDIVLDGRGYLHAFPKVDQWASIHSVNIDTGVETLSSGGLIYAGTLAKLHPNGNSIYGTDNGLSPSDIERYDISGGPAVYATDSPYHGDYPVCGNLWIAEDGLRIYTRCGTIFRASADPARDMTYNGSLPGVNRLAGLDYSQETGKILALEQVLPYLGNEEADTRLLAFDNSGLTAEGSVALPQYFVGDLHFASHGRFVFLSPDGRRTFVIAQVDAQAGLLKDMVIYATPAP